MFSQFEYPGTVYLDGYIDPLESGLDKGLWSFTAATSWWLLEVDIIVLISETFLEPFLGVLLCSIVDCGFPFICAVFALMKLYSAA